MNQQEFGDGDVVLEEGAPSDFAYRIILGEVEIFSGRGDDAVVLGVARAGEFLGEMGIIERRPRSASARARGNVVVEKLERWEFIQLISDSPISANRLIERLSERLRLANLRLARMSAAGTASEGRAAGPGSSAAPVRLLPATERLAASLPAGEVPVTAFPFTVGREPRGDEPPGEMEADLKLPDRIPYRISLAHFAIIRTDHGFAVRDLGSARGTCVNGAFIGDNFERDTCDLNPGRNTVVAGGMYSIFGFNVMVGEG